MIRCDGHGPGEIAVPHREARYSKCSLAHILVSAPPHIAPSESMHRLEVIASSNLFKAFPMLKKRY